MTSSPISEEGSAAEQPAGARTLDRPELSALGVRMRSGLAWKAGSQVTAQLSRTAMTIILARLLTTGDFGLAGMALVFSGLIQLLADVGFSSSLIQLKVISEEDRSTAFWTGVGVATVLFGVAVVVAPEVAGFFHQPRLRWMFVAIAAGLLTAALSTTQASLLWRRMEFRALELRGMFATVVSAAVGIGAAFAGLGAWSLILQANALAVTSMLAIWVLSDWKPSFTFSKASLRRMAAFSANVFFARFLSYGDRNADNLLVGRFLGSAPLGIYSIGYSVILVPFERLVWPIQNVIIPAMASLQDDLPAMRALWLRGVRAIASIIFPAMAGVIVVCPDFVSVVLGGRWLPAVRVIQILAWVALIQSVCVLGSGVFQSRSRTGLLLRMTALGFGLDLASFVVGLHWGVRGVATAYAIMNTLVITPLALVVVMWLLEARLRALVAELRGVVEATLVMTGAIVGLQRFLELEGLGAGTRLIVVVAAGLIVYPLMCWWREPRVFSDLRPRRLRRLVTA